MTVNCNEEATIKARVGDVIECVTDVLNIWGVNSIAPMRKAKAWTAFHQMNKIWNSDRILKIRLFQAIVEAILLYGSET